MDLMNIGTTKETTDVTLYNPVNSEILTNEDRSEMTITVHGPYSKKYKTISHAQQNRRLMKAQRTGGKLNLTAEEIEASALDLLVKWYHVIQLMPQGILLAACSSPRGERH